MRNISAVAVAELSKSSNVEPVILIRVFWNGGNGIIYSDRRFEVFGFEGKILSIGPIDDVVNIEGSSTSAEVSVLLDDSDGTLKQIFNTSDIHKTRVQVLQWFSGIAVNEAFVIFDGEINSPIEWKESDRTLSFNVVTAIEDSEVGISIEETTFSLMPEGLIGRAWPVAFGTVGGIPALLIQEPPSGVLAQGVGVVNLPVWEKELEDLEAALAKALSNWREMFQAGVGTALQAAGYKSDFPPFHYLDLDKADALDQAAQGAFNQAAAFYAEAMTIDSELAVKRIEFAKQKSFNYAAFKLVTNNMPVGQSVTFKVADITMIGTFNGQTFNISSKQFPKLKNDKPRFNLFQRGTGVGTSYTSKNSELPGGQKFYWLEAGTQIRATNFPVNYIASIGHVNVFRVFGYQNGLRTVVPNYYYTVQHTVYPNPHGSPLLVTFIRMAVPLTSRVTTDNNAKKDITWDNDQIEVDCTGGIGPNGVDIMIWAINNFTRFTYDAPSFNSVRPKLDAYPCNFVLTDRKPVSTFLKELAFQLRCAVWLNDNKFYIRYLSERPTPVDTITDDDVLVETLSIVSTETENLVTKLVAMWKARTNQSEYNKIIYKYNTLRYGIFQLDYDFYAFNVRSLVAKSAQFWIIRKSNTFKIIKFKTALNKLRLENFDPVTLDLEAGLIANGPILGIVQKASYNSDDNTIDFEVWIPVRFGEMTEYIFAHPAGLTETDIYPVETDPNLITGSPFEAIQGSLPDPQTFTAGTFNIYRNRNDPFPPVYGDDEPVNDENDVAPTTIDNVINPGQPVTSVVKGPTGEDGYTQEEDYGIPLGTVPDPLEDANEYLVSTVGDPTKIEIPEPIPATFPGQIVSGTGEDYQVRIFTRGLSGFTTIVPVKQLKLRNTDTIPEDTWVEVHRHVWKDGDQLNVEYTMQTPIWFKKQV